MTDVQRDDLGTDLRVFAGDLTAPGRGATDIDRIDLSSELGDVELIAGVENIVQALRLRLLIPEGELTSLSRPRFGSRLHELIGEPNTGRTHVLLMAYAREALLRDHRVTSVGNLAVSVADREVLRLEATVTVRGVIEPIALVQDISLGQA